VCVCVCVCVCARARAFARDLETSTIRLSGPEFGRFVTGIENDRESDDFCTPECQSVHFDTSLPNCTASDFEIK